MPRFPDPARLHPITLPDGSLHEGTVHLSVALKDHPNIRAGDFSYYSDPHPPSNPGAWAARLAPYLYAGAPDHLHIGRFCQIAAGARFITASANHDARAVSTFPFAVFDPDRMRSFTPDTRDTTVGHDVWIGTGATILPGTRIGSGAIVGAGAVVGGTVPPYAVIAGNPARIVRMRFTDPQIERLLDLAWWHWPTDTIAAATTALMSADPDALDAFHPGPAP